MFFAAVNLYIESGKITEHKYRQILFNKFLNTIRVGNSRAIKTLLNNPVLTHYKRDWASITTLFRECCGLSHRKAKYQRALRLVSNPSIDLSKHMYSLLTWCAKLHKRDLFDAIMGRNPPIEPLELQFEDILNELLTISDGYYVSRFLDYIIQYPSVFNKVRNISGVWWCRAHINLVSLKVVLEKLKPRIKINEYIYIIRGERNESADTIIRSIWSYCVDREIDIDEIIRYSLRLQDHEYLRFITRKLSTRELTAKSGHKINQMLIKIVNARGYTEMRDVLNMLYSVLNV
jgi:hypothetical protein